MATIKARKQANGEMRYTAIVRVRSGQTVLHSESKTFGYRSAASTWAKRREVALEDPAELRRAQDAADSAEGYKLAALIRWYIDTFESLSKWQRSKQTHLEFLERHALGAMDARKMTTQGLHNDFRDNISGSGRTHSDFPTFCARHCRWARKNEGNWQFPLHLLECGPR